MYLFLTCAIFFLLAERLSLFLLPSSEEKRDKWGKAIEELIPHKGSSAPFCPGVLLQGPSCTVLAHSWGPQGGERLPA